MISALGLALSTLPLGARFAKMLLLGKEAGVLLHAAALVAAMSEKDPFLRTGPSAHRNDDGNENDDDDNDDDEWNQAGNDGGEYSAQDLTNFRIAREAQHALKLKRRAELAMKRQLSMHPTSDALARLKALGAFVHAEATAQATAVAAARTSDSNSNSKKPLSSASSSSLSSPSTLSGSVAGRAATVLAARRSFCARLGLHEPTLVRMTKVLDQLLRLLLHRFPDDSQLPGSETMEAVKKQALQCGCVGAQHPSPLPPLAPPSSTEEASLRQVNDYSSSRSDKFMPSKGELQKSPPFLFEFLNEFYSLSQT